MNKERLADAVLSAHENFWSEISAKYPEITSGDLDPKTVIDLQSAMAFAVNQWLQFNQPKKCEFCIYRQEQ